MKIKKRIGRILNVNSYENKRYRIFAFFSQKNSTGTNWYRSSTWSVDLTQIIEKPTTNELFTRGNINVNIHEVDEI